VPAFPNLPTAAEAGVPGYEVATWYALWAPKNTPAPIVTRMTKELQTALQVSAIKEAWGRNGSDEPEMTGADFGAFSSPPKSRVGQRSFRMQVSTLSENERRADLCSWPVAGSPGLSASVACLAGCSSGGLDGAIASPPAAPCCGAL
jgi:hypothetical protein